MRCSSQVNGRPVLAAVRSAVARSGKAVQAVQGAVAMSGKGAVRAPVQAAVGAAVATKMLCMSGKGSLCRVLGNQQVLELCTRGFKIEKNFVSNV